MKMTGNGYKEAAFLEWISQSKAQEDRSKSGDAGKGTKTGRRRSLSNLVHPPLGNDEAYPPRETELVDHVYSPFEMEGFPTSETFFYLRYQEESRRVGGPYKYLPSSQPGGNNGVDGALAVFVLAVCGVLYLLFRKRSCFINCGWKDNDRAREVVRASENRDIV